jgi:FkbM family methyltransferase
MTSFLKMNTLKNFIKVLLGKSLFISLDLKLPTHWFGNPHAGFYVYTRHLNTESIVYSFGVGEDISFDLELIKQIQCKVFAFDPTPKSIQFVQNKLNEKFIFHDIGISNKNGKEIFYMPPDKKFVSGSTINRWGSTNDRNYIQVQMKTFGSIIKDLNHSTIDLIKMDIEGAEYDVIVDILSTNIYVKQIVVEFHHRFSKEQLQKTKKTILKLRSAGYKLIAVSANKEEFTFLRDSD